MDWTIRIPSVLYRLAVKKAGSDRELQAHIRGYLERWVNADAHQAIRAGWNGGAPLSDVRVYCPDCQQVHTPGHCPKGLEYCPTCHRETRPHRRCVC